MGRPRLSPTVPYAETNSKTTRGLSTTITTPRPGTLTDCEDVEPAVIRGVGQTRTLMVTLAITGLRNIHNLDAHFYDAHDKHPQSQPPHV